MTTTQLVILWYGGLAVVGLLAVAALDKSSLWYGVAAIATLTILGVVTAAPWNKARRAWVALWVAAPIVLVSVGLVGWQSYFERRATTLIQRSEVDVTDVFFHKRDGLGLLGGGAYFDARVKNRSKHTLARLAIEFDVAEPSGDVIDRGATWVYLTVPSGEVRPVANQSIPLREDTVARLFPDKKKSDLTLNVRVTAIRAQ